MDLETIKLAVKEAMKEEMKDFYIDRKEHFEHHQFIKNLKTGVDSCQSLIGKVTLVAIIGGIITVIVLGAVSWVSKALRMG